MSRPSLGAAAGLCLAAAALAFGLAPLSDNSFFTHLATGRLIIDLGHLPGTDPFTFTAQGEPWVVQSWLATLLFAGADDLAGEVGLRLVIGALVVGLFAVAWRLSRPAEGLLVRVGIGGLVLGIGATQWSERPLLIGLIAIGLVVLVGEGELDPRWLIPVGWVWVNSHGSFPLGVAYLLVVALGRRLDHLDASVELRALRWLGGGILLGVLNPLGPKLLLFPVQLLQKQDVLSQVVEWRSPSFQDLGDRLFLLQVGVAILALVRRPRYRNALVVVVFVAAALLGSRNVAVASLVLIPVIAEAWPGVGTLRASTRDGMARLLTAVGAVGLVLAMVARLGEPAFDLDAYPVHSLDLLAEGGVDLEEVRLASIDRVGNLQELRDGPGERVFFDDRFDMFPEAVSDDAFDLTVGRPRSLQVLDHWDIDLVLWPREAALAAIAGTNPAWRSLDDEDPDWILLCRVGVPLSRELGTC